MLKGESQMSESLKIPFHVEMNRIIELLAKQIYQSPLALLRENCQNAYDAILQRNYLKQSFEPQINITITPTEVRVTDNGIGMTKQDLINHYWRAGSSGKNNPDARAAGVVGTFGIGAMANFGIASQLRVITESAINHERTRCLAVRETLSATDDCIEMVTEPPTGQAGTTIIAEIPANTPVDVANALTYISNIVGFLRIPVLVNESIVSQHDFESNIPKQQQEWSRNEDVNLSSHLAANIELNISKAGEVWLGLRNIRYFGKQIEGVIFLRQGRHQIRTYRSRFALATAAVGSTYSFGGIADLTVLEPTAGREALTTDSLQLLQSIVTESEKYVSEKIAETPMSDTNTNFLDWVVQNNRYELCSNLAIRIEPDNESIQLEEVRERTQTSPINYFEGSDQSLINQFATNEQPLIVISTRQPRRRCELTYLQRYCNVNRIADTPSVLSKKRERDWSLAESAFALRMMSILDSDYFVKVRVEFGKISHNLPILVNTSKASPEIVLDSDSPTVSMILRLYDQDFTSLTGMIKDFVRNVIFPKISSLVPSSTRQGAEAVLRAMRRPRDVFEYESSDLGSLSALWQDYLEGKITLQEAAQQSTSYVQTNYQYVDYSATRSVSSVLPDVLENQRILEQVEASDSTEDLEALPAITRLDTESTAKMLTIGDDETPLKEYRCFIALTERVREERSEFFLQPHTTEIVWGGQKALYIFQHHSGEFGLYYEMQSTEVLADTPGGKRIPTCTVVLKNQIYIPVPDEIREKFIPHDQGKKKFEIRCELLYPDTA
jgi:molecular chaperone HtpG